MRSQLLSRAYASSPLLLFLATLGWGSNTIASRLAVGEVSPMLLIFFRWGIVVVILVSLYWREMIAEWPVIKPRLKWLLIMGGCGLSLFKCAAVTRAPPSTIDPIRPIGLWTFCHNHIAASYMCMCCLRQ